MCSHAAMRLCVIVCTAVLLSDCGGGGEEQSQSFADGLGVKGRADSVVKIASGSSGQPNLALDDSGGALVVWQTRQDVSNENFWSRRDAAGTWEAPKALTQFNVPGLVLRANPNGTSAVLGTQYVLLRYDSATGWEDKPTEVPIGDKFYLGNSANLFDLAMLPDVDRSVVLSLFSTATVPSGKKERSVHVVKHDVLHGWSTILETAPLEVANSTHLATNVDGSATLFWSDGERIGSSTENTLHLQSLDVLSSTSNAALPFLPGAYSANCHNFYLPKQLTAAASQSDWSVIAITHQEELSEVCNFDTILVEKSGASFRQYRMNSPGTTIKVRPPLVAMSQTGNALAIWSEGPVLGDQGDTHLMWSESIQGSAWSTPKPLLSEPDIRFPFRNLSLAINSSGQTVIATKFVRENAYGLHNQATYLGVGRFNFGSGLINWQSIANQLGISDPAVAINSAGDALVVYGAWSCDRYSIGVFIDCEKAEVEMYAFDF